MYVDENKSSGLLLAAVHYSPSEVGQVRTQLRNLLIGSQQRLHFSKEKATRKSRILELLLGTGVKAVLIQSSLGLSPNFQRQACLEHLAGKLQELKVTSLLIEQDDSVVEFDRKVRFRAQRTGVFDAELTYGHLRPHQEPLLWVADAFAWCWAYGGQWRAHIKSTVDFIDSGKA